MNATSNTAEIVLATFVLGGALVMAVRAGLLMIPVLADDAAPRPRHTLAETRAIGEASRPAAYVIQVQRPPVDEDPLTGNGWTLGDSPIFDALAAEFGAQS